METEKSYKLLDLISGVFTASLIISNILAFKIFVIGDIVLDAGILIFPVVYIINDILAEVYGFKIAKRIIFLGFFTNLLAVILYNIAMYLPSPDYFEGSEAFKMVLGTSFRILLASFVAYLSGSLTNSYVLVSIKKKYKNSLLTRFVLSTLAGETVDSILFITIAFLFVIPLESLLIMIISQIILKTLYELFAFPITKVIVNKVKIIENINY